MLRAIVKATSSLRLVALLVGMLLCIPVATGQLSSTKRSDRAHTWGPAIAIGTGTQTVGIGGQLLYYFQLPAPRWRVALHLGAGATPSSDAELGTQWGMNGGAFFGFGRRHRLVFGAEAGTLDWSTLFLHGAAVDMRQVPGMCVSVGWEWMSSFGLFTRGSIGPAMTIERASPLQDRDIWPWFVGGWVLGYKPW
jgi:hypothetical protein